MPARLGRISQNEFAFNSWSGCIKTLKILELSDEEQGEEHTNVRQEQQDNVSQCPSWDEWNQVARFYVNDEPYVVLVSQAEDSLYQFLRYCCGKTVLVKKEKAENIDFF